MRRHNYVGIDPQALLAMAEVQAFRNDFAGGFGDKYRQPVHHAERDVEESPFGVKTVPFHEGILCGPRLGEETCGRAERRGRETRAEREVEGFAPTQNSGGVLLAARHE